MLQAFTDIIKEYCPRPPPGVPRPLGVALPGPGLSGLSVLVLYRADLRGEDCLPDRGPGPPHRLTPTSGIALAWTERVVSEQCYNALMR